MSVKRNVTAGPVGSAMAAAHLRRPPHPSRRVARLLASIRKEDVRAGIRAHTRGRGGALRRPAGHRLGRCPRGPPDEPSLFCRARPGRPCYQRNPAKRVDHAASTPTCCCSCCCPDSCSRRRSRHASTTCGVAPRGDRAGGAGVLISAGIVAVVLHLATGMDPTLAFVVGSAVAATDPAAVITIFKRLGTPRRLGRSSRPRASSTTAPGSWCSRSPSAR